MMVIFEVVTNGMNESMKKLNYTTTGFFQILGNNRYQNPN